MTTFSTRQWTVLGGEIDIAQLIADGLDLKLKVVPVSWADWPLGVSFGKYDLVTSNVTVTEERLRQGSRPVGAPGRGYRRGPHQPAGAAEAGVTVSA